MPSTNQVSSISNCYRLIVSYTQFGQVVAALFATDCFMCTVVQNHQAYKCRVS